MASLPGGQGTAANTPRRSRESSILRFPYLWKELENCVECNIAHPRSKAAREVLMQRLRNAQRHILPELGDLLLTDVTPLHQLHVMVNLPCKRIQCDETWSFCYAKDKNL